MVPILVWHVHTVRAVASAVAHSIRVMRQRFSIVPVPMLLPVSLGQNVQLLFQVLYSRCLFPGVLYYHSPVMSTSTSRRKSLSAIHLPVIATAGAGIGIPSSKSHYQLPSTVPLPASSTTLSRLLVGFRGIVCELYISQSVADYAR
jgi:hypothetical protein